MLTGIKLPVDESCGAEWMLPVSCFCATDRGLYTVVQTLRLDSRAEKPSIANQDVLKSKELTS